MNSIPLISNVSGVNFSMNRGNTSPEVQMRQEINTSLVALKKEAGTLEGLINEASQILDEVNNRIATLENDTVKKNDVVNVVQSGNMNPVTSNAVADKINSLDVSSVGGNGKYISAISETDGVISATASDLATSVQSGNSNPVTSDAVATKTGVYNNTASFFNTEMLNEMDSRFSSATNYTIYSFGSYLGQEFGVYGFKHNDTRGGICIVMSVNYGVFIGRGTGVPSTWTYKRIIL